MNYLTAEVRVGRRKYEARLQIPRGATADPHAMEALKNRLRVMIAAEVIGHRPITFRTERHGVGTLRSVS